MAKDTTGDTRHFTIFFLNQNKKLEPECHSYGNSIIWSRNGQEIARIGYEISTVMGDPFIRLDYKSKKSWETEWRPIHYKVPLERLPCHFGGIRWYFRCSLIKKGQYCGRRVAILYSVGDYFGCRHCANLTYDSCLASKGMRGYPWKILTDSWKGDELYGKVKRTHYKGNLTRKYKRCLRLWGSDEEVLKAEKQLYKSL